MSIGATDFTIAVTVAFDQNAFTSGDKYLFDMGDSETSERLSFTVRPEGPSLALVSLRYT